MAGTLVALEALVKDLEASKMIEGGCQCGALRFKVDGEITDTYAHAVLSR